jgi:Ca2+-binding RTX toxin-like protein
MPRQIKDRYSTWVLDGQHRIWTLAAGTTIDTTDGAGIEATGTGNDLRVLGDVFSASYGVRMEQDGSKLRVGGEGHIFSQTTYGVTTLDASDCEIVNHGVIQGGSSAVRFGAGSIENFGRIDGVAYGVFATGNAVSIENEGDIAGRVGLQVIALNGTVTNMKRGEISGRDTAVEFSLGGVHNLINGGTIFGGHAAVTSTDGTMVFVRNTGTIVGDIMLGNGHDSIDTRGGIVRGEINGGEGDDTYLISSRKVQIVDMGQSFSDSVRSTVSYRLTGGLDHLSLIGRNDINATGNDADNALAGNQGRNRLSGGLGSDIIDGRRGNDRITGGADADLFIFRKEFGRDRITDFIDRTDFILSDRVMSQKQFERLDIRQVGDDTVIDFGRSGRLTLDDVLKADIGFDDFAFP